jgi:hypothetical protein
MGLDCKTPTGANPESGYRGLTIGVFALLRPVIEPPDTHLVHRYLKSGCFARRDRVAVRTAHTSKSFDSAIIGTVAQVVTSIAGNPLPGDDQVSLNTGLIPRLERQERFQSGENLNGPALTPKRVLEPGRWGR